jgi:hypothetical protein
MEGFASSNLVSSTISTGFAENFRKLWDSIGFTLGGFVAGEGFFCTTRRKEPFVADGSARLRFIFGVTVARRDVRMLEALQAFLGHGTIRHKDGREPHHQPLSEFAIVSARVHHAATIPFGRRFILPSAKRQQFDGWVETMARYEEQRPSRWGRGPSPCSMPGCDRPVRGQGLCRSHYYRATGY